MPDLKRLRIGLFFRHLRERYSASFWPAILETLHAEGADALLFPSNEWRCSHNYADLADSIISLTGDLSVRMDQGQLSAFLERFSGRPLVHISAELPGGLSCLIDNRSGIREAVRHLALEHGMKDIAFVTGPEWHQEAMVRLEAYRDALEELGLPYRTEWVYRGAFLKDSGAAALAAFLDERRLPLRSVICSNDVMALALIEEAARRGLETPRDLLVVGFDDYDTAMIGPVSLTTVRQPFRALSRAAARAALGLARGESPAAPPLLPVRFVARDSCGCRSESIRSVKLRPEAERGAEARGFADPAAWRAAILPLLAASARESVLAPEEIEAGLASLLDAYLPPLRDDAAFLDALGACLEAESRASGDPLVWHFPLSLLSGHPGPFPAGEAPLRAACLQRGRIMVEESNFQLRIRAAAKHNAEHWTAQEVIARLLAGHSRERLGPVLAEALSSAGVPSAVVALYGRPLRSEEAREGLPDTELSVLCAYALDAEGVPAYAAETGRAYPAADLFPPGFPSRGRDFAIEPLRHGDLEYGIVLQEISSPRDGLDHEMIGRQISAAYGLLLVEEERQAARRALEEALESLREANEKLFGLSRQDELCGLLNRRGFMEEAERGLALAKRMDAECVAFFVDMDGLKDINDGYGHDSGDAALRALAAILRAAFRATDSVARLGGDEFTAFSFMSGISAPAMAARITGALERFNQEAGLRWKVSASIGYAAYEPGGAKSLDELLREADAACYREKARRRAAR